MKPKVAFICVHNSCRSQMAETLVKFVGEANFSLWSLVAIAKDTNECLLAQV